MTLADRAALVTGAASGIGASCARRLAKEGAHVLVLDRDAEAARGVATEIGSQAMIVDLADVAAVDAALTDCEIDIVVNNAGLQRLLLLHEFPREEFTKLLSVMVEAPFRLARATLPGMYARGWGRFVHITSIRRVRGDLRKSAYVAAKHAIEGLSKTIALEGGEHGVTSNCISPAWVETPLTRGLAQRLSDIHGSDSDRILAEMMLGGAAIKELVTPEEIAELVVHLWSGFARHTTGTTIRVDGGWLAG